MVDVAEVYIWGELAGAVQWDSKRDVAAFQYDRKFLNKGYELSPIKMPLENGDMIYRFPELRRDKNQRESTFKGLPGLLADALPDRYGNQLMDVWLAQNGRPPQSMNPVEQLCFIGSRGMSALEFEPALIKTDKRTFKVEINSLVSIAQKMLSKRTKMSVNLIEDEQRAMKELIKIGTSAGGARPKAVIAFNEKTGEVRSGQTKAPKGFEHWLIKLDGVSGTQFGVSHGYGRVEYAYYLMTKDCGINMTECRLLEENDRAHFMTKRFDREKSDTRHHIQTLCGINHFDYANLYSYGYEQLFQTMRMLKLTYPEAEQMFRRMVFNVMATNFDDHTKNFAFRLKQKGKWELAPAYDVCFSYDPTNEWVNQHTMSINGKHKNIKRSDLLTIAEANSIKKGKIIIDEIKDVVCGWDRYARETDVASDLTKFISQNLAAPSF